MEGRRHSVDVPISRTLIALRRVRSLRDPSTNSMSKLSALVDNLNWETNSNNAITLGFENNDSNVNGGNITTWKSSQLFNREEPRLGDHELYYGSKNDAIDPMVLCDNKLLTGIYCNDYGDKELEFSHVEGGDSCNSPDEVSTKPEKRRRAGAKCRIRQGTLEGSAKVTCGDALRLYRNDDDVGFMDSCHQGCGINSCWSRNSKFRESNLLEEQPLLLGNGIDLKHNNEGICPNAESPRSLSQKFMPRSFDELVGQNLVATSLLSAITTRKIAPLYLFHGPRGTGKTSASRIFAAALNCISSDVDKPCGLCQECVLFFSGRSRDVKEVDSVRLNKIERCRSLVKNARSPPVFSRFKVYVIDECHLLQREIWAVILNGVEELPPHVVFILVTPSIDKVPRGVVSKSQRYHFQKVKEIDIAGRLGKICVEEGIEFDEDALKFIASKSNGSIRDAEMMLDQLSLLGKKISVPLVYEVNGVVSDDELLDLLHLALSSDAANTVKRARELMKSRIDPLQLISQLANLIMDILAGKCPVGVSEVRRKLFGMDNCEADMQQLSHALKVLSQTEKQLRASKNQTTWLTAALLQLSSTESPNDVCNPRLSMRSLHPQDGDFHSTSSTGESLKHPVPCACEDVEPRKTGCQEDKETLDLMWMRASGMCTPSSLKKFLQKRGKLVSIRLAQGIAVAELEFDRPDYVSKAEKSWKMIAGALQHTLGYNMELRINLASNKHGSFKKPHFSLFNCSRRVHLRSHFSTECASETSDTTPTKFITRDKYVETCSSESGSHPSHACCHGKGLFKTIRNNDGNSLSVGVGTPNGSLPDGSRVREEQSGGYPWHMESNKECLHSVASKPGNKLSSREYFKFHCWRTATFPFRKAWQLTHQHRNEHLVDYALHCAGTH